MSAGGFVMVPEWLRRKKPSGNAYTVYITLGSFGTFNPGRGTYEECRPSLGRMIDESGLSRSSVKRALAELVSLGAAKRIERRNLDGSSAPSVYRLIFGEVREPELDDPPSGGRGPSADPSRSGSGPQGGSPEDPNQEPSHPEPKTKTEVEWPNYVGRDKDPLHSDEEEPEAAPETGFTDWRSEDRDLFHAVVGDKLISDGSEWTKGTWPADTWYDTFRKREKPLQWPGRYLSHLVDTDGLENWLLAHGLEPAT